MRLYNDNELNHPDDLCLSQSQSVVYGSSPISVHVLELPTAVAEIHVHQRLRASGGVYVLRHHFVINHCKYAVIRHALMANGCNIRQCGTLYRNDYSLNHIYGRSIHFLTGQEGPAFTRRVDNARGMW